MGKVCNNCISANRFNGRNKRLCCENCVDSFEPVESEFHGDGQKVLVVEDNTDVCHMLTCQLKSAGYEVVTAEDGEAAMHLLRQIAKQVRIVLLDIDLPKKDGLTCLQEFRSVYPGLPVVLMSGLASIQREQFDAPFLRKPFTLSDLLATVDAALNPDRVAAC